MERSADGLVPTRTPDSPLAGALGGERLTLAREVLAEEAAGAVVGDLRVELGQRLIDDLAHALAADADAVGDLLERQGLLTVEAEAETEDLGLALIDGIEEAIESPDLLIAKRGF